MSFGVQWNAAVPQQFVSCGADQATGVYGDYEVRLGKGSSIRLAEIKPAVLPYPGFKKVSKVRRSKKDKVSVTHGRRQSFSSLQGGSRTRRHP